MVLGRLAYLVGFLAVGVVAQAVGLLDDAWIERINALAFYVALPALVFTATHDQSFGALFDPELVVGLWTALLGTASLAWLVHRNRGPAARRSVAIVQSYHGNLGYLGLPLVVATFGERAGAAASLVLGVMFVVQVPLTILLLVRFNGTTAPVRRQFRALAANPVLWAIVAGVAVSTLGVTVPGVAVRALDPVGSLALPIALVLIGGSLDPDLPAVDFGATGSVVAIKVAAMPALAAAALGLLGVSRVVFVASVVMLAMPTAVSTYVYATELGGDSEFASLNVFATTVIAVVTLVAVTEILA